MESLSVPGRPTQSESPKSQAAGNCISENTPKDSNMRVESRKRRLETSHNTYNHESTNKSCSYQKCITCNMQKDNVQVTDPSSLVSSEINHSKHVAVQQPANVRCPVSQQHTKCEVDVHGSTVQENSGDHFDVTDEDLVCLANGDIVPRIRVQGYSSKATPLHSFEEETSQSSQKPTNSETNRWDVGDVCDGTNASKSNAVESDANCKGKVTGKKPRQDDIGLSDSSNQVTPKRKYGHVGDLETVTHDHIQDSDIIIELDTFTIENREGMDDDNNESEEEIEHEKTIDEEDYTWSPLYNSETTDFSVEQGTEITNEKEMEYTYSYKLNEEWSPEWKSKTSQDESGGEMTKEEDEEETNTKDEQNKEIEKEMESDEERESVSDNMDSKSQSSNTVGSFFSREVSYEGFDMPPQDPEVKESIPILCDRTFYHSNARRVKSGSGSSNYITSSRNKDYYYDDYNTIPTGNCLSLRKKYDFPNMIPMDIDDVIDFWETDFQVGDRIIPCMGSWEENGMVPCKTINREDYHKYVTYKNLYVKWLECNKSKDNWYQKYCGFSLRGILVHKTVSYKTRASPGQSSRLSLGDVARCLTLSSKNKKNFKFHSSIDGGIPEVGVADMPVYAR